MSEAHLYELMKPFFEKQIAEIDPDFDDLGNSIYAAMTERLTPRQIGDAKIDDTELCREIAFAVFRARHLPPTFLSQGDVAILDSVVAALVDPRVRLQLTFKRKSRGRQPTFVAFAQQQERERQVYQALADEVKKGEKLESIIADVSKKFGLSRSTIFQIWKRHDRYHGREAIADEIQAYFKPWHKSAIASLVAGLRSFFRF